MQDLKRVVSGVLLCAALWAPAIATAEEPAPPAGTLSLTDLMYHVLVAEFAVRRGRLDTALEHYRTAVNASDDPRLAERATGIALFVDNQALALEFARRWQALAPDDPQSQQSLALALLRNDRLDEAVGYLESVRAALADRDGQDGFAALANLLGRLQDKSLALSALTTVSERHPDSAYGHYYRALAALAADQPETALGSLEQALAARPGWREALLLQAQVRLRQNDTDAAVAGLAEAVDRQPQDTELRLGYARVLVAAEQLDAAREQFARLAEQNPEDAEALFALGVLATEAEQYAQAEEYFRQVMALGQRVADSQFELARIAELQENYRLARERYEQVGEGERYLNAQVRVAVMDAKLGEFDAMHERFEDLRAEDPDNAVSLYISESEVLRGEKRYQAAFDILSTALDQYPGNHDLLYSRALAAEKIDRLDRLEQDLRRILADEPDNGQALNALGYTLADRTDRHQEALALIRRALEQLPDDPAVLDSMGWVKYKLGDNEEALKYLQKAYDQAQEPEIVMHLSEVLWSVGKRDEARTIWEKAYEKAPEDEYLLRIKDRFRP